MGNVKKNIVGIAVVAALGMVGAVGPAWGAPVDDGIMAGLKKDFPKLLAAETTAVPGLYELVIGKNIVYYFPANKTFFFGEMWKGGKSLTGETRAKWAEKITEMETKEMAPKLAALRAHLDDALKIGSGPTEVIEIIDPDCPYCRKMHTYWERNKDKVTRYVFLMPLPQLHPNAEAKTKYILGAKDKVAALNEVVSGKLDRGAVPASENGKLWQAQRAVLAKLGINGTPAYFVKGVFVSGADVRKIDSLLKNNH